MATTVLDVVQRTLPEACETPTSILQTISVVFSTAACFKATLSLVIGMAIVVFAGIIKLPQIVAILSAKSGEGIATATILLETFGYVYNFAAHVRQQYPLSTYGDFAVLTLQNCIIIFLIYRYSGRQSVGVATVATFAFLLLLMCSSWIPLPVLRFLTLGNVALSVASRVPQITSNHREQSTGKLSAITCCGIFLGASARVFTTLQDVDSINILLGYMVSACLNGIIAFQVLYYGDRSKQRKMI